MKSRSECSFNFYYISVLHILILNVKYGKQLYIQFNFKMQTN